jgi:dTDP-4-amino-4,6-dideoxygalactose transaminase
MGFPFINLAAQHAEVRQVLEPRVRSIFESGRFIMGEEVSSLESQLAAFCGTQEAVGVDSGTRALELIWRALGIGPGDEVITTPFTFFATVSSILQVGARPVFADIDPATLNIDPISLAAKIGPKTKAIAVVHLFGLMADMPRILDLAGVIPVIEDACQSIGASIAGRPAGSWGRAAALSFFPTKNLGGAGDGGMVLTSDPDLASQVRLLRNHGSPETYRHETVGCTGRLDALQAAVLRVKLPFLSEWNARRAANALAYDEAFGSAGFLLQSAPAGFFNVRHQYAFRTSERDSLAAHLKAEDVPHAIYYPLPAHLQAPLRALGSQEGDCPYAEEVAGTVLSLPVCPHLDENNRRRVIDAVLDWKHR